MATQTAARGVAHHREMAAEFLAQKSIAVVGVSELRETPANAIYAALQKAGHTVYPVNPKYPQFKGARCYRSLAELSTTVDGVVIVTRPEVTEAIVSECIAGGIRRIWIHNMLGTDVRRGRKFSASTSSVSPESVARAEAAGVAVIAGGCPMQHIASADPFHRCVLWVAGKLGNYG